MTGDDLARLGAQLDAAVSHWRDERRRKAQTWVIEAARDRAQKLLDDYSDAIVLAHTAPRTRSRAAVPAAELPL